METDAWQLVRSLIFQSTLCCAGMQEHRSLPSIVAYIVFNEGWGQYETERVTRLAQALDASRLFDPASGWVDAPVRSSSRSMQIFASPHLQASTPLVTRSMHHCVS